MQLRLGLPSEPLAGALGNRLHIGDVRVCKNTGQPGGRPMSWSSLSCLHFSRSEKKQLRPDSLKIYPILSYVFQLRARHILALYDLWSTYTYVLGPSVTWES